MTIQLAGRNFPRKLYRVSLVYQGDWFKPNGEPRRRDPDNQTKVLFDVLAECLGFDDCWLNRDFTVRCEQSASERVNITLT